MKRSLSGTFQYGLVFPSRSGLPNVRQRPWRVIVDPSEGQPFLGRFLRQTDFDNDGGGLEAGTVLEHALTGERRRIGQEGVTVIRKGKK